MPPIRIVSFAQVASLLQSISLDDILLEQAKAFNAYTRNATQTPQRLTLMTSNHTTLIMPSRIDSSASVIKLVSVPLANSPFGLPGATAVMDDVTGEVSGLVNARLLTALRTAAGSGLATRLFLGQGNKSMEKKYLLIFGSGAQAESHVIIMLHVQPQIQVVTICNRTKPRAQELVEKLQNLYPDVIFEIVLTGSGLEAPERLQEVVHRADIICTCTNSNTALFDGHWVKRGAHVNMVGSYKPEMHEVDQVLMNRSMLIVDATGPALEEAGELIDAERKGTYGGVWFQLGELVDQQGVPEKTPKELVSFKDKKNLDVTMFKSVGIAAQDVAITAQILKLAAEKGVGSVVEL